MVGDSSSSTWTFGSENFSVDFFYTFENEDENKGLSGKKHKDKCNDDVISYNDIDSFFQERS